MAIWIIGCGTTQEQSTLNTDCFWTIQDHNEKIQSTNRLTPELVTAKLERSRCYMQLGEQYFSKGEYETAARLFYFANSNEADERLSECLWILALAAYENNDLENASTYLSPILTQYSHTIRTPNALCLKIRILMPQEKGAEAWSFYKELVQRYPSADCRQEVLSIIEPYIDAQLTAGERQIAERLYTQAIKTLEELFAIPSSKEKIASRMCSQAYQARGELFLNSQNYDDAVSDFKSAKDIFSGAAMTANQRISAITDTVFGRGTQYYQTGRIESAESMFKKVLAFDSTHIEAKSYLQKLPQRKLNLIKADSLAKVAEEYYQKNENSEALRLASRALEYDPWSSQAKQIIQRCKQRQQSRTRKKPEDTAMNIVKNYRNGKIPKWIEQNHKGKKTWKAYISRPNIYQVECRVYWPNKEYQSKVVYEWSVDTKSKKLTPLNRKTQQITY